MPTPGVVAGRAERSAVEGDGAQDPTVTRPTPHRSVGVTGGHGAHRGQQAARLLAAAPASGPAGAAAPCRTWLFFAEAPRLDRDGGVALPFGRDAPDRPA